MMIDDTEQGFCNKRSSLTNLLDFYKKKNYGETKAIDIIYLDFLKAFDKVPINDYKILVTWHNWENSEVA